MLDIDSNSNFENNFIKLLYHINFFYEEIFSNELILNFIVDSDKMINRYKDFFPNFNRRQLECAYLAMTIFMITQLNELNIL